MDNSGWVDFCLSCVFMKLKDEGTIYVVRNEEGIDDESQGRVLAVLLNLPNM